MKKLRFFLAAITIAFMAACNNVSSPTFTVEGTVEGLADGDMLFLTDMDGLPLDTLTVKDGKFSYTGSADSVCCYALNVMKDDFNSQLFFTEPGIVTIKLSAKPNESKVSGSVANNALQQLMEATNPIYEKIHEIESIVYNDTTMSHEDEWALNQRYDQLYSEVENKMKEAAEQNIDNELGYMLVMRYIDESENAELLIRLIGMMPQDFRNRQPLMDLEARITALQQIADGQRMPDFTLATPEGENVSVLSEVRKNTITVLDFWASWCGPCRQEMPFMRELYATYHPKGLGIVGISLDDDGDAWGQAISDLKIEWPQLSDLQGGRCAVAQHFQVTAIPFIVVVDAEGTILSKSLRGESLKQFVAERLGAE